LNLFQRASPRLKDAEIPADAHDVLYRQLVLAVRTLFHSCRLVHADLSEYNILYHKGLLAIIDVSQSVEHDHPHAFDFLRSDVKNVESFFAKAGVRGLGPRRCFEFVIRERFGQSRDVETDAEALERWLSEQAEQEDEDNQRGVGATVEADARAHEDEVFLRSYIPRTLNEVYDPERDISAIRRGEGKNLIYAETIGVVDHPHPAAEEGVEDSTDGDTDEDDGGEEDQRADNDNGDDELFKPKPPRGHRNEDKEAKKVRGSKFSGNLRLRSADGGNGI
jgi:RIO kinase 1